MSYTAGDLCCIHHGSGDTNSTKLWMYYTTDNLASNVPGSSITYFHNAYNDYPNIATGDIIMAVNGATPFVSIFAVTVANPNGVSVAGTIGMTRQVLS